MLIELLPLHVEEQNFDISPYCVFVFYDHETEFIKKLIAENNNGKLGKKYPEYSFLIIKRQKYQNPSLSDLSSYNIISRVVPKKEDKVSKYLTPTSNENKSEISKDFFDFFMKTLENINSENNPSGTSTVNAKMGRVTKEMVKKMTQLFQSESSRAISNAQTVTLKLVKTQPRERRVGTHVEYEPVPMEKYWSVELFVDGHRYIIPFGARKSMKAIFVYMLLHPNHEILASNIDREEEVPLIIKTLYPKIASRTARSIKDEFEGSPMSRQIGIMKRLAAAPDEYLSVAPFEWISKIGDLPLGNPTPSPWIFSPPDKVTIDTESFRQAMDGD